MPLAHGGSHETAELPASDRVAETRLPASAAQAGQGSAAYGLRDPLAAMTQPALLGALPDGWSGGLAGSGVRGHPTFSAAAAWVTTQEERERVGFGIAATGVSGEPAHRLTESRGPLPRSEYASVAGMYQKGILAAGACLRMIPKEFAATADSYAGISDEAAPSVDLGLAFLAAGWQAGGTYRALGAATLASVVAVGGSWRPADPRIAPWCARVFGELCVPTVGGSRTFGSAGAATPLGRWMPDAECTIALGHADGRITSAAGLSAGAGRFRLSLGWTFAGGSSPTHAAHAGLTLLPRSAPAN